MFPFLLCKISCRNALYVTTVYLLFYVFCTVLLACAFHPVRRQVAARMPAWITVYSYSLLPASLSLIQKLPPLHYLAARRPPATPTRRTKRTCTAPRPLRPTAPPRRLPLASPPHHRPPGSPPPHRPGPPLPLHRRWWQRRRWRWWKRRWWKRWPLHRSPPRGRIPGGGDGERRPQPHNPSFRRLGQSSQRRWGPSW